MMHKRYTKEQCTAAEAQRLAFILELYPYPQMEQKEILTRLHILLRFHKKGTSHYRFSVTEKI